MDSAPGRPRSLGRPSSRPTHSTTRGQRHLRSVSRALPVLAKIGLTATVLLLLACAVVPGVGFAQAQCAFDQEGGLECPRDTSFLAEVEGSPPGLYAMVQLLEPTMNVDPELRSDLAAKGLRLIHTMFNGSVWLA